MSPESATATTKLCPTCGTRLSEDATRCLVCGAELGKIDKPAQPAKSIQGSRMPEITISLPVAIGLLALFLTIGAAMVFLALKSRPEETAAIIYPPTATNTATLTVTPSITPTNLPPTTTNTPEPSPTPLSYVVQANDTCLGIAAYFRVSVEAIRNANNLSIECVLNAGKQLSIPQPTPTATPLPTTTLSAPEMTEAACKKATYTVVENDTPSKIASAYNVPWQAIKEENGLPNDAVYIGQKLVIPLCKKPTPIGPTATVTPPPPYPSPNLLLPPDGAPFTLSDDTVTLQWASVGTLRENEAYAVTVEDITGGQGNKLVEYVTETKFIVPANFRPNDKTPHVFRWWVLPVRQTGTADDGKPIWEAAGSQSASRVFTWWGAGSAPTPTP